MPNGAAAAAIPSPEERRRATELRASRRRRLITPLPATQTPTEESEEPAFGEEGFGEEEFQTGTRHGGAREMGMHLDLAAAQKAFAQYQAPKQARGEGAARQGAVLAAEQEAEAAREFETNRLGARRLADSQAAVATASAAERARQEASRRAAQWMMRLINDVIGDVALSETIIAPFVSFLIKNVQLFLVNIYNGGKSVKIPGLQWIPGGELPRLEWWEVVYVVFLDIVVVPLVLLLNPITLPIVIIVGAGLLAS